MTKQQIEHAIQQYGGRVAASYRDQHGFIVHGIVLALEGDTVAIDAYTNKVPLSSVISIKYL